MRIRQRMHSLVHTCYGDRCHLPEGLADKLGNAFKEDTAGANNGYPILVWQAGEVVQPDPRIELTGSDTLWRTTNDAQPQTTITAACKDMDEDTHVDWTLTEGEGIVTLETPEARARKTGP